MYFNIKIYWELTEQNWTTTDLAKSVKSTQKQIYHRFWSKKKRYTYISQSSRYRLGSRSLFLRKLWLTSVRSSGLGLYFTFFSNWPARVFWARYSSSEHKTVDAEQLNLKIKLRRFLFCNVDICNFVLEIQNEHQKPS